MLKSGKEASISIRSDVMTGHPEHHEDEEHVDADGDLFEPVLAKLVKIDVPFLITVLLFLLILCSGQQLFFPRYPHHFIPRVIGRVRLRGHHLFYSSLIF